MKLFFKLWGPSEGPRLVLLHGIGGTGALWRPLAAGLETQIQLLAPDQRGHGKSQLSDQNASYTPLDYAQDVLECLQDQHWDSTWLLGHSMGVRTAVAAAFLKPACVQGLILIDLGFSPSLTDQPGAAIGKTLATFLKSLPPRFPSRAEAKNYLISHCPEVSMAYYLLAVAEIKNEEVFFPFDITALVKTVESIQSTSIRPWVEAVAQHNIPILILRGAQSTVWQREAFLKEKDYFSKWKNLIFEEVPHATHGLPFEQRGVLIQKIQKCLLSG